MKRTTISLTLGLTLCLTLTSFPVVAQATALIEPVTDEELQVPPAADWLSFRGNLASWGYSALEQINRDTVSRLSFVWSSPMEPGPNETTPAVRNGILYIPHSGDVIQALDARTGDLIWEYRREWPADITDGGSLAATTAPITRSLAIYDDGIFYSTGDAYVIRLDANTGELLWESQVGDYHHTSHSTGPIIANGKVISGRTCDMELVGGCYIAAHDADDGRELWRFHLIPRPGEPGDETWGGLPYEERVHVGAWYAGSYDPELDLIFWGTSVPAPSPEILRGSGDGSMLYSNSTLAIDPDTGELAWYFQHLPRDNWDLDHPFERILVETEMSPDPDSAWVINPELERGKKYKVVTGFPGKTAILWTLDAETGKFLWAKQTVFQNVIQELSPTGVVTVNTNVIPEGLEQGYGTVCPGLFGGKNWPAGSYSPKTGALYAPLHNLCMEPEISTDDPEPDDWYAISANIRLSKDATGVGRLEAVSASTGKTLWVFEEAAGQFSTLATGGDLVFAGNSNRRFRAYDAENGDVLWETRLNGPVTGFPISFEVDGEQYVAVSSGGGDLLSGAFNQHAGLRVRSGSNSLYAFKLGAGSTDIGRAPLAAASEPSNAVRELDADSIAMQREPLPESTACATFTTEQAERGRETYEAQCTECHGGALRGGNHGPSLTGRFFRLHWKDRAASALHATVRESMPPGREETLGPRATSEILGYVFQTAGIEASLEPLSSDVGELATLRICP